ncbi:TIGR02281 family clan AA aspartic protease [Pararhodobacter sp. SW119]|uniref:retropepsin-like aspartic protease family protein n=1 Tax=Pararhodobacter sp. SW119 TaxID=2780075 RepID=UPI001ADEFE71|nr:TIGR02281 family clan AA aspartic protease [Pararhodobacter sp. SW119]
MSGDPQIERLVYLSILGTVLIGYFLLSGRAGIGTMLRHLILWALIITGVAAAYGLVTQTGTFATHMQQSTGEAVELQRGRDGHFHLTAEVTGPPGAAPQQIRFIVDTGATELVLSKADAERLGFRDEDLAFLGTARTANGVVRTAMVLLDSVQLGEREDRRVRALVNEGQLDVSLLGMGYLNRFARIEMTRDRLRLEY